MKKINSLLLLCSLAFTARSQSVGIGTNAPNASAQLDITATSKGLLIPRMNTAAITAIPNPARGLMVLDTAKNQLVFNIGSPAAPNWQSIAFNSGWGTAGNAGTNPAINFIGTTDDKDVVIKRNNVQAGLINTALLNTSWGSGALNPATAGGANVANGADALQKNTLGSYNTANGAFTLNSNTTGFNNTATGAFALYLNTLGDYNSAYGLQALKNNISGNANTAIGVSALYSDTSGSNNTATGFNSLRASKKGNNNSAYGYEALSMNTSGENNIAIGMHAGAENTTGSSNVFLGYQAGQHETGSDKLYISNSDADSGNALLYGEFDNKILSVGGRLGIGTTTPKNLLHVKNANTDNDASQLVIEGNSNYGDATTAAIEFRSNFSSGYTDISGRIKSYYASNYYADAQMVFQTMAPGPALVNAMVLSNGNVNVPNGSIATAGNLSATGNLFAGGHAGIGITPGILFPLAVKGSDNFGELVQFYNGINVPKWHLTLYNENNLPDQTDLNFAETGIANYRLYLKAGGEIGMGKIPFTTDNDSRLQVKQQGSQNGIGVEAGNSTNHWDFYATGDVANTKFNLYYNGSFKGAFDNVSGAYTAGSDRRLKKDIAPLQPLLTSVLQLKAYRYHYLDNEPTDRFSNGFMAQDVQQLFPDAVIENTMKDGQKRLGINYQYFTVLAIKGLQEQQQQIQTLEERIARLEAAQKKD